MNPNMSTVVFVKDEDTLNREMKLIIDTAKESEDKGKTLFVALDTESENIRFQKNQVCVVQISYKIKEKMIHTIVIMTDFCTLKTKKHEEAGKKLFLTGSFMNVLTSDNIVFVGAAIGNDLLSIDEKFFLEPNRIRFLDVALFYNNLRSAHKLDIEKSCYSLKDTFDFIYSSNSKCTPIRLEKNKTTRMADWNSEFRGRAPWTEEMRSYAAKDAFDSLLTFEGICLYTEGYSSLDLEYYTQSVLVGGAGSSESYEKLPVVCDYEFIINAYYLGENPHFDDPNVFEEEELDFSEYTVVSVDSSNDSNNISETNNDSGVSLEDDCNNNSETNKESDISVRDDSDDNSIANLLKDSPDARSAVREALFQLAGHVSSPDHFISFAKILTKIDNVKRRIELVQQLLDLEPLLWKDAVRPILVNESISSDPLFVFFLLDRVHLLQPQHLLLTFRIKRAPNLTMLLSKTKAPFTELFLQTAASFSMKSKIEKREIICKFNILPMTHPLLTIDETFEADFAMETIRNRIHNISKTRGIPNPMLRYHQGVTPLVENFLVQFIAGEMEKHEIHARICDLAKGCDYPAKVVQQVNSRCPELAFSLSLALAVVIDNSNPHEAHPWSDASCTLAPHSHQLGRDTVFVKTSTPSEYAVLSETLKSADRIIMNGVMGNAPLAMVELLGVTLFTGDKLFYVSLSHTYARRALIVDIFRRIAELPIYTYYGKRLVDLLRKRFTDFRPPNIIDHYQLAKLKGMKTGMNAVCQIIFNEEFCRRTLASPKELPFSEVMQGHLIMSHKLLYKFACDHVSSTEWEAACAATVKTFFKPGRGSFYKKRINPPLSICSPV